MRDADLCAVVDGVMNFYCYTVCLFFIVVANYEVSFMSVS